MKTIFLLLLDLPFGCLAQNTAEKQVDSLRFVETMPYICRLGPGSSVFQSAKCGSPLFWKVVILKDDAIDLLIARLDDRTSTVATVPNFGSSYTVADIAYTALQEIIRGIPTYELLGIPFDTDGCGDCAYWQHLRKRKNRRQFKAAVQQWYDANRNNLVWIKEGSFTTCDCGAAHPNGGHYEVKGS